MVSMNNPGILLRISSKLTYITIKSWDIIRIESGIMGMGVWEHSGVMAMGIDQQPMMWVCPKLKDALEPCDLGGL